MSNVLSVADREVLLEQERLVWPDREDMAEHGVRSTAAIFTSDDGTIVRIGKPGIQKHFCFGYSDQIPDDYEDAQRASSALSKSEEYFISENLRQVSVPDSETLARTYVVRGAYVSQPPECRLGYVVVGDRFGRDMYGAMLPDGARILSEEERTRLRRAMESVREGFEKRLHSYLKRYGLSKCRYWTYWRDE